MQRLIPFGNTYLPSAEFSVDEDVKVTLWLVREDQTTTVGEAEAEIQIRAAVDAAGNVPQFTTIFVLDDQNPRYTLLGQDDTVTYHVVRKASAPSVAVDSSGLGANASKMVRPTAPTDLHPAITDPLFSFKVIPATSGADVGVSYPTGSANPPDYGLAIGAGTFSLLLLKQTGTTLDFTLTGPVVDYFSNGSLHLSQPNGATVVVPIGFLAHAPAAVTVTVTATVPAGTLVDGQALYVALSRTGVAFDPTEPTPVRFTLDANDIPARVTAYGFDPLVPGGERATFFAVENNVPVPATYDDETPIELYVGYQSLMLTAPGTYEIQFPTASNISVFVNTGWN